MRSKALKLDGAMARTYADALEQHILPRLGDLYYDVLTGRDVQAWVDDAILIAWKTKCRVKKRYSPWSVHAWFRVFRAMTRDAMHELGLERDPTLQMASVGLFNRSETSGQGFMRHGFRLHEHESLQSSLPS